MRISRSECQACSGRHQSSDSGGMLKCHSYSNLHLSFHDRLTGKYWEPGKAGYFFMCVKGPFGVRSTQASSQLRVTCATQHILVVRSVSKRSTSAFYSRFCHADVFSVNIGHPIVQDMATSLSAIALRSCRATLMPKAANRNKA